METKALEEWFAAVCANIASGEKLSAPEIILPIPQLSITGTGPKSSKSSGAKNEKLNVLVKYLFSDIVFRQTVTGSFENAKVGYESVQAGKLGVSGGKLGMYFDAQDGSGKDGSMEDEGLVKAWLGACVRMNEKIGEAAGQSLPVGKMLKPRSESGERKVRRLEGGGGIEVEKSDGELKA